MTDKEGFELLNSIAKNLLGKQTKTKTWYCETCKEKMSIKIARLHKKRLGHIIIKNESR